MVNLNKPRQRLPTVDKNDNPTCCFVCGMRAIGLGIGKCADPVTIHAISAKGAPWL